MYLEDYLSVLHNSSLEESVLKVSKEIEDNVKASFKHIGSISGLLIGNVQSGKTAQMFGAISRFADDGYKIFLLLTSDNVGLQRQTFLRAKNSLPDFEVLSEQNDIKFQNSSLAKPILIVLKKNDRVLKKWRENLLSSKFCNGQLLIIFDDEGDNASLNTKVNRNQISTINRNIRAIRDSASASIYFEVTATPQSLILQSAISGWRPQFVNYFKPGKGYLGGDFFYSYPKPYCIIYTKDNEIDDVTANDDNYCPEGLQKSIVYFLIECAHKKLRGESNCNFMIHPSVKTEVHAKFSNRVKEHLTLLQKATDDKNFISPLKDAWRDLQKTTPNIENFEDIKEQVISILDNMEINIYTLNSKSYSGCDPDNPDALNLSKSFNIIVGGNSLGRGITFPHLQIVYYCRSAKTPQADTFWQHSRIFGYDREGSMVRIFTPKPLYLLFSNLNTANTNLLNQIQTRGLEGIELIYPKGINPTRKNVLDKDYLNIIVGGANMFPRLPKGNNTTEIDAIVALYKDKNIVDIDSQTILALLSHVGSDVAVDFDAKIFSDCIIALAKKRPKIRFKLIVRYNRDITKGTGTLLSPNDRALGDQYTEDVVLTLYRVIGQKEKGWDGNPLWIPNIKFPNDSCFYNS